MKRTIIIIASAILLTTTTSVAARGYGHHGHGYRHHGHGYYGHYRHRGHHPAYFFGGLVLGSLLSTPRYPAAPVVYPAPPVRVIHRTSPPPPVAHAPISRRLLRDLHGNCFERKTDKAGNELRVQLPASECAW